MATEDGANAIAATAVDAFGRIDAVINNAGIYFVRPWLEHFAVGLPTIPQRALLRQRPGQSGRAGRTSSSPAAGRIVNTVSSAMLGVPDMVHYGSAKGAVYGFTRNLAVAGAAHGIKVNAIAPGAGTRMLDEAADALPPGTVEFMKETMPPTLVAPVAAYLAHESCSITGEVLNAAGGGVNRLVVANTAGIVDPKLTPEAVADRLNEILAIGDVEPTPLMLPTPVGGS